MRIIYLMVILIFVACSSNDSSKDQIISPKDVAGTDTGNQPAKNRVQILDISKNMQGSSSPGVDIDAVLLKRGDTIIGGCSGISIVLVEVGANEGNEHTSLADGTLNKAEQFDNILDPLPTTGYISLGGGRLTCEMPQILDEDVLIVVEIGPDEPDENYQVYLDTGDGSFRAFGDVWHGFQQAVISL